MSKKKTAVDIAMAYIEDQTIEHGFDCAHHECSGDYYCCGDANCYHRDKDCVCSDKESFDMLRDYHQKNMNSSAKTNPSSLKSHAKVIGGIALEEAIDGGWLTLGKQAAKRSVSVAQRLMEKRFSFIPGPARTLIGHLLQTDEGLAVYSLALGTALSALPKFSQNEHRAKLARSMRVYGWHVLSDRVVDPIVDELEAVVDGVLRENSSLTGSSPPILTEGKKVHLPDLEDETPAPSPTRANRKK